MTYITLLLGLILSTSAALSTGASATVFASFEAGDKTEFTPKLPTSNVDSLGADGLKPEIFDFDIKVDVPIVPFYSQFHDISRTEWQGLGCGIADLAMLIEFYKPGSVSVDALLEEGIVAGAFISGAGWSHKGLALLAEQYGLSGKTYDFSDLGTDAAFSQFETILKDGPVIASVYYKFEPGNPIPHLVVINGISGGIVYYNDPSRGRGGESISVSDFKKAWKKRLISIRL
ncbi:MAG: C39 family peptidase [Parcubacteria group bacterium]|nr:C39 family peptidase [Parcubacteria group bacterium]